MMHGKRSLQRSSDKIGQPPGSLLHIGEPPCHPPRVTVMDYAADHLRRTTGDAALGMIRQKAAAGKRWILVEGVHDPELVAAIGAAWRIHPLVLEDILNTHQRPKFEDHDDYLFIVLRDLRLDPESLEQEQRQVSLLVLPDCLICFREAADDALEPIFRRMENGDGRLRRLGVDYLAYALLDLVVDGYFAFADRLDDIMEEIEAELLEHPGPGAQQRIIRLKRVLIAARRCTSPLRDLLSSLGRSDTPLLQRETRDYLRDVHDHTLRVSESLDAFREMATGLLDLYLSSLGIRMNEVMKVLTVFASIFIPLTFLAGIYGMNFEYMPELKVPWAYPALWCVFIVIAGGLLCFFRRRGWL